LKLEDNDDVFATFIQVTSEKKGWSFSIKL
jgi:hypothetical protein